MFKKFISVFFVLFIGTNAFAGQICVIEQQSVDCIYGVYPCCKAGLMQCGSECYGESYRTIPTTETEKNPESAAILADAMFGSSDQYSESCWGYDAGLEPFFAAWGKVCLDGTWSEGSVTYSAHECDDGIHGVWDVVCSEDTDDDGVADTEDNCPNIANANQSDQDGDGIGDVCDSEPYFFWTTQTNQGVGGAWIIVEGGLTFTDGAGEAILWTTVDPDSPDYDLGWPSRRGIAHSYVSYRAAGQPDWSAETEARWISGPVGFIAVWNWVYVADYIGANGAYELKIISEDADGFRCEEVHTIEITAP